MTRARVCARGCVGACVCEAGGRSLPGVWVCGAPRVCVGAPVWMCVCGAGGLDLNHLGEAGRVGGHGGQHSNNRGKLKFYCRSHWLVDLVLSGFNTPYQIYRTKFIEYLNDTGTW